MRPTVAICFVKSLDEPEIINYTLGTSKQSGKRIRQAACGVPAGPAWKERPAMGIIRAVNLIFDYIRHDEETDKDEVSHALRGVNLDIEEGSFVAILGHNGSGKSTFAKLMNGILLPSDGTVYISDMKTSDEEHLWDVRKTAGMVFQNPDNQIIGNVVEEDVGFGPENMGVPTDEIWKRVDRSLEAVGMTAYRLQ